MIRNASILISSYDISMLRALTEIDGHGCKENALALILAKYFDTRPEIAELVKMESEAKKEARKAWALKHKKEADEIPL